MTDSKLKKKPKILITPLKLGSVTRIKCPVNCRNFNTLVPTVRVPVLKNISIHSDPSDVPANRAYPEIRKCGSNRCSTCYHFLGSYTIKSNVNGRNFNVQSKSDLS